MPQPTPTVLLTRPKTQSARFANGLKGFDVIISPVLEVQYRDLPVNPRDYDGLIFTSENGVRAVAAFADLQGLRGYAVGQRTAEVAAEFGLDLRSADGTADDLVALILADKPTGRWLHPRGVHSHGDVVERLNNAALETESVVVYDQVEKQLTPAARRLLAEEGLVILPVFSPRTAALLGPMCRGAQAQLVLIGMSPSVIGDWTGPEPARTIALPEPSAAAMLEEIQRYAGGVA